MVRVLITGGRAPAALELARQFHAAGATVFAADSAPYFLSRWSSAVERAYLVPSPRDRTADFIGAVARIVREQSVSLIVPTCEEIFYLAAHADRFTGQAHLFCPPMKDLRRLHSKWDFTILAREIGLPVPQTWLLQSNADVVQLPGIENLVFKPVFSRFATRTLIRPTSARVETLHPTQDQPWVAQTFVQGRELCSYAVAREGRVTAFAAYDPRWRAGNASSYYFQAVSAPTILAATERLAAALQLTGQIAFDVIEAADGIRILECNPRATSGVHLFGFADALLDAFMGSEGPVIQPGKDRARMLASAMWLLGVPHALRKARLKSLIHDYRRASDALWSRADPKPSFGLFLQLAGFARTALAGGISLRAAATRDLEWDGEAIP